MKRKLTSGARVAALLVTVLASAAAAGHEGAAGLKLDGPHAMHIHGIV